MVRLLTLVLLFISTTSYTQVNLKSADSIFTAYHSFWINQSKVENSVGIKIWTDFINLYPDDFRGYEQRALLYTSLKDYKSSIEDYSKVIELKPYRNHSAYSGRSSSKSDLGDYLGAISDISLAIELKPNDELYYAIRAKLKYKLDDYRGSIEDYKVALDLCEKSHSFYGFENDYYSNIGTNQARLNNFHEAIESYSSAIKYNSKDSHSFYNRGLARIRVGEINLGCLDFSKAGELGYQKAYDAIKQYCR